MESKLVVDTPVDIQFVDSVSSATAKPGDTFSIRLAEPLSIDGRIAVPAGTLGRGEVIHAKKSGWGGKAGELIVTARYLEFGSQHIPLGHFHFGASGKSRVDEAFVVAEIIPLGALLVSGGETRILPGTLANAKITQEVLLPVASGDHSDQSNSH